MGRSRGSNARGGKHGQGGRKMQNFNRLSTTPKTARQQKPRVQAATTQKEQGKSQKKNDKKNKQRQSQQAQKQVPVLFRPSDRILLVGEGDFSFAASLPTSHGCQRILATCYDNKDTLHQKYPHAETHISKLTGQRPAASSSLSSSGGSKRKREEAADVDDDNAHDTTRDSSGNTIATAPDCKRTHWDGNRAELSFPKVLFAVDARKLGASPGGGGKVVRKGFPRHQRRTTASRHQKNGDMMAAAASATVGHADNSRKAAKKQQPDSGPWDVICFNFPHVGGLSTDVNRQVRANQELLVSFFKACVPLLSAPPPIGSMTLMSDEEEDENEYSGGYSDVEREQKSEKDDGNENTSRRIRAEPGQVIVTLFEGEPYTLWNIRDLARHAGLRVVTSFKFPWKAYPGYSHARTVGEIEGKDGSRGGWRGEDREARSYVFERKDHENLVPKSNRKLKDSDDSGSE